MLLEARHQFGLILEQIAESLDLSPELRDQIVARYHDVAEHLGAPDSALQSASPDLYPQGSFALGTVVPPICNAHDCDVDMVCLLHLQKESVTQAELKERVGQRLGEREDLRSVLIESRRCWRLEFDEGFHMDILPAIPDAERGAKPGSILITDTGLRLWQHSNPKGYAIWFREQMAIAIEREKRLLMEARGYRMSVEPIRDEEVKTPLQRAVQLLKRHRDLHFQDDLDNRPVSIILTTLAAKAYADEDNLYDALYAIVRRMADYIEFEDGKWLVRNPVNRRENFADKWNEYPERREKFMLWLEKVETDFELALRLRGSALFESLKPVFGERVVTKAARSLGGLALQQSSSGNLGMAPKTGHLVTRKVAAVTAAPAISIPKHNFYGGISRTKTN